jgi:uncharacterized protein (DUF1330 family)
MRAYAIFDVDIRDMARYQEFMQAVKPAFEAFYHGPVYRGLKTIRDECSSARLVAVEGPA